MKKINLLTLFIIISISGFSQTINVTPATSGTDVENLVRDVLINSSCANVSNFEHQGLCGIGKFDYTGTDFDFSKGIIIKTGKVSSSGDTPVFEPFPSTPDVLLNSSSSCLAASPTFPVPPLFPVYTDAELQAISVAQGKPNPLSDVSFVKFDFVPETTNFNFKFIFSSFEYGNFQCSFADVFAFILTDTTTGTSENLAVIPGTSTPVSVTTIRNSIYNRGGSVCPSENEAYFDTYVPIDLSNAVMNTNGYTIPMQASATVIPGRTYSIKLVIGDYGVPLIDTAYDSAVLIEGGSFNIGITNLVYDFRGTEISDDMTILNNKALCFSEARLLKTNLSASDYNFVWKKDGVVLTGETSPDYMVSQPGNYCVEIDKKTGTSCIQTDCIVVEEFPRTPSIGTLTPIEVCDDATNDGREFFNLTSKDPSVIGTASSTEYTVSYHTSSTDAMNGVNPLPDTYENTSNPQTIHVRLANNVSGCASFSDFELIVNSSDDASFTMTSGCVEGTATITGTTGGTFNFNPIPTDGAIINNSTGRVTNGTPGTTYFVEYTTTGACPSSKIESVTIGIGSLPTATISGDNICEGTSGTVTITGTPNATVTYNIGGGANQTIDINASGNATITTPILTANRDYNLISVSLGCNKNLSESATVVVNPLDDASFTMTSGCTESTATITGMTGGTFNFNPIPTDGAIINNSTGKITNGTPGTTYFVEYTTTGVCTSSRIESVTLIELPTATISGDNICEGTTGTVTITGTPNATVTYNIDGGANQTIDINASGNATITTPILTANNAYNLISVSLSGCSKNISESANVLVDMKSNPVFSITDEICKGDDLNLPITSNNGITGVWTPNSNNNETTTYTFNPNTDECAITITKVVEVFDKPIFETNILENGSSIEISIDKEDSYEYRLDEGAWQRENVFRNVKCQEYKVSVRNIRGCGEIKSKTINTIIYPKFFTPNGDGKNDKWNIKCLERSQEPVISIYDRYGQVLYKLKPTTDEGWDGTNGEELMKSNDYWFTLEYSKENDKKRQVGHFSLIR